MEWRDLLFVSWVSILPEKQLSPLRRTEIVLLRSKCIAKTRLLRVDATWKISRDPTSFPNGTGGGVASPTGNVTYLSSAMLGTAKTSMTIPSNLLASGKTYVFVVTSRVDGKANMETSPHRSGLPTASAQVISGPDYCKLKRLLAGRICFGAPPL